MQIVNKDINKDINKDNEFRWHSPSEPKPNTNQEVLFSWITGRLRTKQITETGFWRPDKQMWASKGRWFDPDKTEIYWMPIPTLDRSK